MGYCTTTLGKNSEFLKKFSNLNSKFLNEKIPTTESLKNTYDRVLGLLQKKIFPQIKKNGKNNLIAAHGNSLRAFCKFF